MKIISTIKEMHETAESLRRSGKKIGVVPTMGFFHAGHLSLVRVAKDNSDVVVMTIFVNPTQFGPNEDFTKYPRDIERDAMLAEKTGADYLFTPTTEEMYPAGHTTRVDVEGLTKMLEGRIRPTHFQGVTTVVAKLFNIIRPDVAVFGQKDAQQSVVIRRMVKDLNFPLEVVIAPIVRESDGLAMSSRNVYLSSTERPESVVLFRSLLHADKMVQAGERNTEHIVHEMKSIIGGAKSASIDYIAISDPMSLNDISHLESKSKVLISMAVKIGATRLIDNLIITIP